LQVAWNLARELRNREIRENWKHSWGRTAGTGKKQVAGYRKSREEVYNLFRTLDA
jgi:hypothetical protein